MYSPAIIIGGNFAPHFYYMCLVNLGNRRPDRLEEDYKRQTAHPTALQSYNVPVLLQWLFQHLTAASKANWHAYSTVPTDSNQTCSHS